MAETGAIFIKIGAATEAFEKAIQHIAARANKLEHDTLIRPRVDASKIEELDDKLFKLIADAAATREALKESMPADEARVLRDGLAEINREIRQVENRLQSRTWSMGFAELRQSAKDTEIEIRNLRKRLYEEKLSPDVDDARLEGLNIQLREAEQRLRDTKQAADDMRESMTALGKRVESVGMGMSKYITAPLVAAGAAMSALVLKTAHTAEEIINLHASTGLATDTLQELKHVTTVAGVGFTEATNAMVMFQKRLKGAGDESNAVVVALAKIGVVATDMNGELRPMTELFPEILRGLQGVTNETERTMLAGQLFGRSTGILPLLAMTSDEFERLSQQAHDAGVVMGEDTLRQFKSLDDAVDLLKQKLVGIADQFAEKIMPVIRDVVIPTFELWIGRLGKLAQILGGMPPTLMRFATMVGVAVAAIGPLLVVVGKTIQLWPAMVLGIRSVGVALAWLAANPVVAIIGALALIGTGIYALVKARKTLEDTEKTASDRAIDLANAQIKQSDALKNLVDEYITLRDKSDKSNVELNRMAVLLNQIKQIMPEVVKNGQLVGDALELVGQKAAKSRAALAAAQKKKLENELRDAKAAYEEQKKLYGGGDDSYEAYVERIKREAARHGATTQVDTKENWRARQDVRQKKLLDAELKMLTAQTKLDELADAAANEKRQKAAAQMEAANSDRLNAEKIERQIAREHADALAKIEMDKQDALDEANARGAKSLELAAIEKQFAMRKDVEIGNQQEKAEQERIKIAEKAQQDRERLQKEEERAQREREAALKAHVEEMTRIAVAEGKAVVAARLSAMKRADTRKLEQSGLTGLDRAQAQAELERTIARREAEVAHALALGDLQRGAKPGEDITQRTRQLAEERLSKIADIESRFAGESKRIQDERARAAIEANLKIEESNKSAWQMATETLETYADRVIKTLLGEQAMREQQLDRQRAKERAALQESIKHSALRAKVLQAFDAETEAQREEIFRQEEVRDDSRINMIERLKRMTGISSIEGLWRQMANTNLQSAFEGIAGGANFTMQAQMPKIETKELNQTNEILADIRRLQAQSEENTRIMRNELERTK